MLDKIKNMLVSGIDKVFEKLNKVADSINEFHFAGVLTIAAAVVTYCGYQFNDPNLQEMSNRGLKLSLFLNYVVILIKYLGTRKLDVIKEIAEENNIALAILLAAIILGGGVCIFL